MSFGKYIKQLRRQRGLTQRRLADEAGVDVTYLSKIENDRLEHTPSIKTLQGLAAGLEVDELELMRRANKVPPGLEGIAASEHAMRFFRRASERLTTEEEWQDLLDYLNQRTAKE